MSESVSFDDLVGDPEAEIRLAHAALLWAQDEYDDLRPEDYLERLDALADRIDARNADEPEERINALRHVIAETDGYRGNYDDFASSENCYLNRTLDTGRGAAVTLGAIWIDVATQLGWPLAGVAMPGHFVLRYGADGHELYIDPFNGGRTMSREDCVTILRTLFGPEFEVVDEFFAPVGERAVLARMIGNAYAIYVGADDWVRTVRTLERLVALSPEEAMLHAELGRMRIKAGDLQGAATALKQARESASGDQETSTVNHHLVELRNQLGSDG